jgi:penicillin-binding protein 1C
VSSVRGADALKIGINFKVPKKSDTKTSEVFWFADQTFIDRTKAGAGFAWRPNAAGNYLLRAVDDHGRVDRRELRVTVVQ